MCLPHYKKRRVISIKALCLNCAALKRSRDRQVSNSTKSTTRLKPICPSSMEYLTELRTKSRKQIYYRDSRIKKLIALLRAKKENMVIRSGEVRDLLLKATEYISTNLKSSREEILKVFIDLQFREDPKNSTALEGQEYTNYVCEGITNMQWKLKHRGHQCRFSPHIIDTARSLYLRDRKCYDELKASGSLCLPDPRHLRRISGVLKVGKVEDPMIYSLFQEEVQERNDVDIGNIIGHLMLDEVKLKNGIAFNYNSNEVTGFLPEHMNTLNVYQEIHNASDKLSGEPSKKKAV